MLTDRITLISNVCMPFSIYWWVFQHSRKISQKRFNRTEKKLNTYLKKMLKKHSKPPASHTKMYNWGFAFPATTCGSFTSNDHVMCREAGSHHTKMLKKQPLCHCLFASSLNSSTKKRQKMFVALKFVGNIMWNVTSLARPPIPPPPSRLVLHYALFSTFGGAAVSQPVCLW